MHSKRRSLKKKPQQTNTCKITVKVVLLRHSALTTKNEETQAKRSLKTEFLWEQNQNKIQTQNKTNQQNDTLPELPQYALGIRLQALC